MDSVFKSDVHYQDHTGILTHKLTQPTEDIILSRNSELRKNPGVMNDLGGKGDNSWGRQIASIPFIVFEQALRDGFDLNSIDAGYAAIEMQRFLGTDAGKQCLVR